ncbi:MAG: MmcB family DNA repair protein, partial [Candidatus Kariarchaeaceae archaeon]
MTKSWARPKIWIYEIKVSRSDFLSDDKWRNYIEYCNEFYFVASPGIIHRDEIPDGVGLIECSKNCKRLFTKKKAIHRDIEAPVDVFLYILMWRAKIDPPRQRHDMEDIQEWLDNKESIHAIGHIISKNIRQKYKQD